MVEANNISKSFGSLNVLNGVNLKVERGEFVSIVGASGAGKTTLLQILGSLDTPTAGSVSINGVSFGNLNEREISEFRNKHSGFVFQFHQLLPEFTAVENIMIPALIAGRKSEESNQDALEFLDYMNLVDRAKHKPNELSGGERQRVAVARALINRPDVLLADEPTGSLDSKNKEELNRLFLDLKARFNQTLIVVTHDMEMASISDRIIKMQDGRIVL